MTHLQLMRENARLQFELDIERAVTKELGKEAHALRRERDALSKRLRQHDAGELDRERWAMAAQP
jgi:hypothetical protein